MLVAEGERLLGADPVSVPFTGHPEADALLNDLDGHPHAFLFACLVDRQVRAEWAWKVPHVVRERIGSFEVAELERLTLHNWVRVMTQPAPAHRLPEVMAGVLHRATVRVAGVYAGDAGRIWRDSPNSATVVRRIIEFHGAGPKIASMAANILVREFHVGLSDYRYIDISADVHVVRVMRRLGLVEPDADTEVVVWAARELNPDFPGVFDLPLWQLGRSVCRPTNPNCPDCWLRTMCPSSVA